MPLQLNVLERLCAASGVSGREDAVRGVITELLPAGAQHSVDPLGNLIVRKEGARAGAKAVMLCAHMDEVGLIVTDIHDTGDVSFAAVGGVDTRAYLGKQLFVGQARIPGVIDLKAVHLLEGDEKNIIPHTASLRLDIGCDSRAEAEALVRRGDFICFSPTFQAFGEGYIQGKAIDDRIGCLLLLTLLREELPYDMLAVFSTNEETGVGAARTAAFTCAPDYALVAETTTANDLPGTEGAARVCLLGGGAVVPFMDQGTVYPRALYERAMQIAARENIPAQTKTKIAGGNDAKSITAARGGIPTLTVSVPCRGLHSPSVVMKQSDAEASLRLLRSLWKELSAE
ncbi:MAG: M42 family peptidase [Oscillospiraceae bacterium]|jgi:endoglucanase|nr:M42 family peptidase [Oscillospiraceae bacterium]